MEKITIIIPVYNVEKYLKIAIESARKQTYKNLEIILIDDESKDNSGKICDEYKLKDKRIKVVHQKNKGLSGARNTGLDLATGEYIMFLDSDDFFELDACEKLYKYIVEKDADYVIGNYINVDENGKKWDKPVFDKIKYKERKISVNKPMQSFYVMNSGVWNKIFKKSFLDKLNIRFKEKIPAEDAVFTTYCFIKTKKCYYMPEIVYNYRQRYSDSISTNCSKEYFLGINRAYKIIYNNFMDNNKLEFYKFFYTKSVNYILYKFIDTKSLTKVERVIVLDEMRWFYSLSKKFEIPTILKSVQYIIESITEKNYAQTLKYCEILAQVREMLTKELKEKMSKPNANTYKKIEENIMRQEILEIKEKLLIDMQKSDVKILGLEESLNKIIESKKSLARFGDGELDLIIGKDLKFQEFNEKMSKRLEEILKSKQDFCLIGIPDVINGFSNLTLESEEFWVKNMERTRKIWLEYINNQMEYCDANLTRLYIRHKDKSESVKYFNIIKKVFYNRDIVICEGEQTRMGIGNDLLDDCKSIKRIICPSEDAFEKYDEILNKIKEESKDKLIIIALGPTATILAYDLGKEGYQALDIGHLDIEYEWFKRNATKKLKIRNKYTNEVENGNETDEIEDDEYQQQIISIIK